jgi:hypothetical protein
MDIWLEIATKGTLQRQKENFNQEDTREKV